MAGTPIRRARREHREARERGNRRFDDVARQAIIERAEKIGTSAAAEEAGISPGTIRTWRKRRADAGPVTLPDAQGTASDPPATPAGRLRAQAERARAASSRAMDQADNLVRRGLGSEARNAATVAGINADRAQELERAAQAQEKHEQRVTEDRAEQVVGLIRQMFAEIELNLPADLARAVLRGEEVTPELRDQARAQVHRQVRAELRAELEAEIRSELSTAEGESSLPEPVAHPPEVEDTGVTFDDLPDEWQRRYGLNRSLGVHEYTLAQQREQRQGAEHGGRPPRRSPPPTFRHPALEGAGW